MPRNRSLARSRRAARPGLESLEVRWTPAVTGVGAAVGGENHAVHADFSQALGVARLRAVAQAQLGVIRAGPTVGGRAARLLTRTFTLRPLTMPTAGAPSPVLVTGADLHHPGVLKAVIRAYDASQPVALVAATNRAVTLLEARIGHPGLIAFPKGVKRLELVSFQNVDVGGRNVLRTSVLLPKTHARVKPGERLSGLRTADRRAADFLNKVFTAPPNLPVPTGVGDQSQSLLQIADAYQVSTLGQNAHGDDMQIVDTIYAARSFTGAKDLYYVEQEIDVFNQSPAQFWELDVNNQPDGYQLLTIDPGPASNPGTTTVTSSVGTTIGGSVGYNQLQGFNASISGSVTITNSKSTTVPAIGIVYSGNPAFGNTAWTYTLNGFNDPQGPAAPSQTVTLFNQWIWEIPFSQYPPVPPNPASIKFFSTFGFQYAAAPSGTFYVVNPTPTTTVPFPFGATFALATPTVTGVSTPTISPGQIFTIHGNALYPSLVQDVLIGGVSLGLGNVTPVNDTTIQVVAPNMPGTSLPVVVKTGVGDSNDNVSITIS